MFFFEVLFAFFGSMLFFVVLGLNVFRVQGS